MYVVLGTSFQQIRKKMASLPHVMKTKIRTGEEYNLQTLTNIQRGAILALKIHCYTTTLD